MSFGYRRGKAEGDLEKVPSTWGHVHNCRRNYTTVKALVKKKKANGRDRTVWGQGGEQEPGGLNTKSASITGLRR